jgi:hypothetical protein
MVQLDGLSQTEGIVAIPLSETMARIMQSPWQHRGPYRSPPGRLALAGIRLPGMRARHGSPLHRCGGPGVPWNASLVARSSSKELVDACGTLQCSPESQGTEEIIWGSACGQRSIVGHLLGRGTWSAGTEWCWKDHNHQHHMRFAVERLRRGNT